MFADVLVCFCRLVWKKLGIFLQQTGYDIIIRTGHQQLPQFCKTHNKLRKIYAVASCILEPQGDENISRNRWARLIQKTGACPGECRKVDPLVCAKCKSILRIISGIYGRQVIRAILDHLGIWLVRSRPPPKINAPQIREYAVCNLQLQTHADAIYGKPEYIRAL